MFRLKVKIDLLAAGPEVAKEELETILSDLKAATFNPTSKPNLRIGGGNAWDWAHDGNRENKNAIIKFHALGRNEL